LQYQHRQALLSCGRKRIQLLWPHCRPSITRKGHLSTQLFIDVPVHISCVAISYKSLSMQDHMNSGDHVL